MSNQQSKDFEYISNQKLLFVIHGLPMGGAEKFLIRLLNHLVHLGNYPDLLLLSADLTLLDELSEQINIQILKKRCKIDLLFPLRIKKIVEQVKPDLIICINPYSFFMARVSFLFNKKYRFCLSPHSTIPFSFKNYVQNYLYMLTVQSQDLVICLCQKQKEFLSTNYPLGSNHISIINNGIDFSYFNSNQIPRDQIHYWEQYCNIQKNDKIVLLAARITEEKRHIDAIDVIAKLNRINSQKCHLLIVGDGPERLVSFLKKHTQNLNQDAFVHFLGSKKDVRPFYAMADLFVLTSFSETFSIAVIEALSFGVPVAITNVGGASEMVVEGFNGVLTEPKDIEGMAEKWMVALNRNYNHTDIIQSARSKFDLPIMLQKYERVFFDYSPSFKN